MRSLINICINYSLWFITSRKRLLAEDQAPFMLVLFDTRNQSLFLNILVARKNNNLYFDFYNFEVDKFSKM